MTANRLLSLDGKEVPASSIDAFASTLDGTVLRPGAQDYEDVRRVWNHMIDKRPGVIVRCARVEDVVRAVNFARDNRLLIAVRGGGHSFPGKSVSDGGITIDMSSMKTVAVDPARRIARVDAGVTLGEFDRATQAHGLATTMGTAPPTGVAGLTLGGGFGWLMGKHGLACDNLSAVEIVTADGRHLRCDQSENADLFWAVRGGGGNFGNVTSFEVTLHPLGQVLAGALIYPMDDARRVLGLFREFTADTPDEMMANAGILPLAQGPAFGIAIGYCGEDLSRGDALVNGLRKAAKPVNDTVRPMSYVELQTLYDVPPVTLSAYARSAFLTELSDDAIGVLIDHASHTPSPTCAFILEHLHGEAARKPVDACAFAHRRTGLNLLAISLWLDDAEKDGSIRWIHDLWDAITPHTADAVYVNYLDEDEGERRVRAAYGENYDRLARIKRKYDPENLFRLNQNIAPAHQ